MSKQKNPDPQNAQTPPLDENLQEAPGAQKPAQRAASPSQNASMEPEGQALDLEHALTQELAQVQGELTVLQAKNVELADQYLRAQAEAQNARRRAEEEIGKARKFALEAFAQSLLPVCDSLEAGLAASATREQIREGTENTLRQLKSVLEHNKVLEIAPAAGAKFDPHQHQAISVVPAPDQEPNTVVGLLQKGYTIADRVLRPALVTVSGPAA
ncbi:MAG: nucleotide exchange factor GrpE [Burkholderiaceae bacterium]|jgi:molecular chaperone GrpE|nr:nucleotide exchange factor GrpE [Burkholderiaceae bacterium]